MIRTLAALSVLVAAALAVTFLEPPLLYVAAGLLVLLFLFVLLGGMRRKRRPAPVRPAADRGSGSDLQDLGILEIRPREKGTRAAAAPDEAPPAVPEESAGAPLPGAIPEEASAVAPTRSVVRIKTAPQRPNPDEVTPEQEAQAALEHLLNALLHASGAHTVCLLREESGPSRRYHIAHIVSRNAYARTEGAFVARVPFAEGPDAVLHVIGGDVKLGALRYYREELEALRRLLAVSLTRGGQRYVLAADSMEDETLATPRARFLIESTARMIEQVERGAPSPVYAVPSGPPDPAAPRPRSEIIAEEMAGAPDRQLALALVHQAAEDEHDLDAQEAAFEATLRQAAPDVRIERFGEMTFGVFVHGPIEKAEAWVGDLYTHLTSTADRPVNIGMAFLSDRHETPADLRADATEALRDAFESGQPVLFG